MADAITDAMIRAGLAAYADLSHKSVNERFTATYLAMQAARQPQVPAEDVERRQRLAKQMRAYGSKFPHRDIADDFNAAAEIIEASITALQVTEGDKLREAAERGLEWTIDAANESKGPGDPRFDNAMKDIRFIEDALRSQSNKVSKP